MERHPEGSVAGHRFSPAIETDPDHPDYLGPILIPLGEIVLFARPGCESADRVRAMLRARGLAWRDFDTSDPSYLRRAEQFVYTSYLRTPILCACGYAVVGFDEPRMSEVLDEHMERLRRMKGLEAQGLEAGGLAPNPSDRHP